MYDTTSQFTLQYDITETTAVCKVKFSAINRRLGGKTIDWTQVYATVKYVYR